MLEAGDAVVVKVIDRDTHQTYGAVRRVHSFFPYNVTDARNTKG